MLENIKAIEDSLENYNPYKMNLMLNDETFCGEQAIQNLNMPERKDFLLKSYNKEQLDKFYEEVYFRKFPERK